jgi:hypothetical protein
VLACALGLTLVVGLALLGETLLGGAETLASGRLLEFTDATVSKVRVADSVTLYVEPATAPTWDLVHGMILFAVACFALLTAVLLRSARGGRRAMRFFAIASVGAGWLALDELFGLHEAISHNAVLALGWNVSFSPDAILLAAYVLGAAVLAHRYRDVLLDDRGSRSLFEAGAVVYVSVVVLDAAGYFPLEEVLELAAGLLIVAGFGRLAVRHAVGALTDRARSAAGQ